MIGEERGICHRLQPFHAVHSGIATRCALYLSGGSNVGRVRTVVGTGDNQQIGLHGCAVLLPRDALDVTREIRSSRGLRIKRNQRKEDTADDGDLGHDIYLSFYDGGRVTYGCTSFWLRQRSVTRPRRHQR